MPRRCWPPCGITSARAAWPTRSGCAATATSGGARPRWAAGSRGGSTRRGRPGWATRIGRCGEQRARCGQGTPELATRDHPSLHHSLLTPGAVANRVHGPFHLFTLLHASPLPLLPPPRARTLTPGHPSPPRCAASPLTCACRAFLPSPLLLAARFTPPTPPTPLTHSPPDPLPSPPSGHRRPRPVLPPLFPSPRGRHLRGSLQLLRPPPPRAPPRLLRMGGLSMGAAGDGCGRARGRAAEEEERGGKAGRTHADAGEERIWEGAAGGDRWGGGAGWKAVCVCVWGVNAQEMAARGE